MTSNKLGVYNLLPINRSVMIGNGQSITCTHKGKLDVICKHKDESMARETWDVNIVPQLNHDLFSFTKAMKEGWQMNGRWKEGVYHSDQKLSSGVMYRIFSRDCLTSGHKNKTKKRFHPKFPHSLVSLISSAQNEQ